MSVSARAGCLPRIGGALALDFCNTTTGRGTEAFVEHLFDHEDLLRWAVFNELLTPDAAAGLAGRVTLDERTAAFRAAMRLRALLNRIFDAVARGRTADPAALVELAGGYGATWNRAELVSAAPGYAWRFEPADTRADAVIEPILRSAVAVLTGDLLERLKACPGLHCGWVFLDASKNGSRVWCEMEVCGTRAKLRKRAAVRRRVAARRELYQGPGS
ncbi:MAG: CGNR zinc finger domain-containing protein [Geminicoccaceae bacterium]